MPAKLRTARQAWTYLAHFWNSPPEPVEWGGRVLEGSRCFGICHSLSAMLRVGLISDSLYRKLHRGLCAYKTPEARAYWWPTTPAGDRTRVNVCCRLACDLPPEVTQPEVSHATETR